MAQQTEFDDPVHVDVSYRMVSDDDIFLEHPNPNGSTNDGAFPPKRPLRMECITFETMGGSYQGLPKKPFVARGVYVAPGLRGGAGSDMRRRNNENYVRVTNLSKDTRETDLYELFSPFGSVRRVYVSIDKNTDMCRGCGYVTFVCREDAQRAINKLNGYSYNNLILRVEWPSPRTTYEGDGGLL